MSKKSKKGKKGPSVGRKERDDRTLEKARQRRASLESSNGQKSNVENGHEGNSKEVEMSEGRETENTPREKEISEGNEVYIAKNSQNGDSEEGASNLLIEVEMEVATGKRITDLNDRIMKTNIEGDELYNSIMRGIDSWNKTPEGYPSKER